MAQTVEESFDVRLGITVVFSEWRCIGQRRQPCLCPANVVEQGDRVELLELLRIPTHPVSYSDNIWSVIPEYPVA